MSADVDRATILEAHWNALLTEIDAALDHRRFKGGQHVGLPPDLAYCPISALKLLHRRCADALEATEVTP